MNLNLISIIVPTFNRSELLVEMLESVLTQTYQNWECLVVDDGSTDNTPEIMEEYIKRDARIQYHERSDMHKPGGSGARNYGLELSKGEYVVWFDNDDVMLSNYLFDMTQSFRTTDNCVITSHYVTNAELDIEKEYIIESKYSLYKDYILWGSNFRIVTANVLFRKKLLMDNKFRFNEDILRGQEAELFYRIFLNINDNFNLVQKPGFLYRQHPTSKTHEHKTAYNPIFCINQAQIYLSNLKIATEINDSMIENKLIRRVSLRLFQSKRHSKSNYFYIVNGLKECYSSSVFWRIRAIILKMYYYFPNSNRMDNLIRSWVIG